MANRKKGQQSRNITKQKRREIREEENKATSKRSKKSLIIIISLALVVAIVVGASFLFAHLYRQSGAPMRSKIYANTEHFAITGAMESYFLYETYNAFLEYYGSYATQYFKIDVYSSLKKQMFDPDNNISWFDYFVDEANDYTNELLYLCEYAYENNIELTQEEKEAFARKANETDPTFYGTGVKTSDIELCYELETLAAKTKGYIYDGIDATDEEVNDYLSKHKDQYLYGHYRSVTFKFTETNASKIEDRVAKLKATKSDEEFASLLKSFYTLDGEEDPESKVKSSYREALKGDLSFESIVITMIFESEDFDVIAIKGSDEYNVYCVSSKPEYDYSITKNVRHMMTNKATCGSNEKAEAFANSILDMYNSSSKREEDFAKLAMLYSCEQSTLYSGGLYSNTKQGEMTQALNDWIFDDDREYGDTTIISNSYGYHILYYIGDGYQAYYGDVYDHLRENKYQIALSAISKTGITITKQTLDLIQM